MRCYARLLVTLIVAMGHAATTQSPPQDARAGRLAIWRNAIERHTPGSFDNELEFVARWPRADLDAAFADLKRTAAADELPSLLRRAILLHTDILVFFRHRDGYDLSPDGPTIALAVDGVQVGSKAGSTIHWDFTRGMVSGLRGTPTGDAQGRQWYQATTALLEYWDDWAETMRHLARAKPLFPPDAVLTLYEGCVHEAYASASIQALREPGSDLPPIDLPNRGGLPTGHTAPVSRSSWSFGSEESELNQARTLFERALTLDPSLAEAHVRLGRVLSRQGRHRDALARLTQGLEHSTSPLLRFWALLFLGHERAVTGDPVRAAEAFEEAAALYPLAQAPLVARSQLAFDQGHAGEALDVFQRIRLPLAANAPEDPWREYNHEHAPTASEQIDALRAAFQQ